MVMAEVEILRAACCVAGLDRQVCQKERPLLEKMAERIGVGQASLNAMIERAQNDPNFYQEQFRIARAEPEPALKTLLLLAAADHTITLEERVILQHFAERLGVDQARFETLLDAAEKRAAQSR